MKRLTKKAIIEILTLGAPIFISVVKQNEPREEMALETFLAATNPGFGFLDIEYKTFGIYKNKDKQEVVLNSQTNDRVATYNCTTQQWN